MTVMFKRGDVVRMKAPLMPTGTFAPMSGEDCVVSSVRMTSLGVQLVRFKGWTGDFYAKDYTRTLHTEDDLAMALELAKFIAYDSTPNPFSGEHEDYDLDAEVGLVSDWLRAEVIAILRGER